MSSPAVPDTAAILAARPARNAVDPRQPYAFLTEPERTAGGKVEDVATLFLTNRECPYRCLMCDLWKNTLTTTVPVGSIPAQIDYALARLPPARHIKLYNSGNFFDPKAIPPADWPAIAKRVKNFATVVVENHPRLCTDACGRFQDLIGTQLEIALGLETIHPEVLPRLNKQMTVDDYRRATELLKRHGIAIRTFILLRPPWLTEAEGREWASKSIELAFDCGSGCCAVIPTRAGNGILDRMQAEGSFEEPRGASAEVVLEQGLRLNRGRVFLDLWDAERWFTCAGCRDRRVDRLNRMNLNQMSEPPVECDCERDS